MKKFLGNLFGWAMVLAVLNTGACQAHQSCSKLGVGDTTGNTIRIQEFYLSIPGYMDLLSTKKDPDYENVMVLRYGSKIGGAELISIVIRKSCEPKDWKALPHSNFIDIGGLSVGEGWYLEEATNLPGSEFDIAILHNEHYEIKVIGREPALQLEEMISQTPKTN